MIGLFGGSFDPVHFGHLKNINLLSKYFVFDKLLLMPCGIPPHKNKLIFNQKHRLKMLQLAIKDCPNLQIEEIELNNKISYTIDTLEKLYKDYHNICFIMGADSFAKLNTWDGYKKFHKLINIIVLARDNIKVSNYHNFVCISDKKDLYNCTGKVYLFDSPLINISSTAIHGKIRNLENLTGLMPDSIIRYINEYTTKNK